MFCVAIPSFAQTELTDETAESKLLVNNDRLIVLDFYATWCGPCKKEIPFLKEVEEKYHGKDIEFVSISTDNAQTAGSWENAFSKWKNMVKKNV